MNIGHEHKSSKDVLAAILGQNARPRGATTVAPDDAGTNAADDPTERELEIIDVDAPDDAITTADLATPEADASEAADAVDTAGETTGADEEPDRAPRRRARAATSAPAASGGLAVRIFGLACLCAGIATTVLDGRGQLPAGLQAIGFDSSILFVIGSIAWVLGAVRRQTALAQARITAIVQEQQQAWTAVQQDLQALLGHRPHADDRPPAAGEELAQVLAALQRQDEKVNNLSRALKMYGKPLMEITNQGADVSAQLGQLKGQIDATLADFADRWQRAGTSQGPAVDLEPLERQVAGTQEELRRAMAALGERLHPAAQQQQQQLVRIEASVQALSQRLDDSEVRKSLLRLEDTTKQHGKVLAEAAKADTLQQESQRLERHLDLAIGKVGAGVEQVRDRHLEPLENAVRELQRDLSGLLTSVAYIQQSLKNGARAPAPAAPTPASPPPAGVPAMPGTPPPSIPTAATAASTAGTARPGTPAEPVARPTVTTPAPNPNATADAQAGVEQNKTGARATTGKNVLGAIAKLKKMKG